jgi:hypothetical protein
LLDHAADVQGQTEVGFESDIGFLDGLKDAAGEHEVNIRGTINQRFTFFIYTEEFPNI